MSNVLTPEFRAWFGASKVTGDDGRALVVYHGTRDTFDAFDLSRAGSRTGDGAGQLGFFFSGHKGVALFFTEHGADEAGVVPVYLSIVNPERITASWFQAELASMTAHEAIDYRARLIAKGCDGIIVERDGASSFIEGDGETYIAFRPEQIKSAIGNCGRYDPCSPSILD